MNPSAERRLFITILVALVLVFAIRPVQDSDTFWHLATGRLILEQGVPGTNTFSFTFPEYPWPSTEWLFDSGLYLVFRAAGFNGLIVFNAVIILLTVALLADTMRQVSGRCSWGCLLVFASFLQFSRFRFVSRPHLATFLFLSLLLNLWFRPKTRAVWAALPVLAVVWANMHAGFVLGVILALLLLLGRSVNGIWPKSFPETGPAFREGVFFVLLFIPCTLLNRSFTYPYRYTFQHLSVAEILPIDEFQRTTFHNGETFFLFAALLFASFFFLPRKYLGQAVAVSLPFFVLALFRVRIIPKFGIVAIPFLCLSLTGVKERFPRWRLSGAAGLLLAVPLFFYSVRDLRNLPPGWGFDGSDQPVGAMEFLQRVPIAGNLYNDFDDGGYLIFAGYPARRVFQDGRIPHYPAGFFREVLAAMSPEGWSRLMDKYRITCALVKRRGHGGLIDYSAFFVQLGWPLVYLDGSSMIFLRNTPLNADLLEQYAFRVLRPATSEQQLLAALKNDRAELLRDLRRLEPGRFSDRWELLNYGYALYLLGQSDAARAFLTKGKRRFPAMAEYDVALAQLVRDEGDQGLARRLLDGVIEKSASRPLKERAIKLRDALPDPAGVATPPRGRP